MKKLFFILLVSAITFSCKKSNGGAEMDEPVPNPHNSIFGEWKYTEYYVSPGIMWHWEKVDNGATLTISEDFTYKFLGDAMHFPRLGTEGTLETEVRNSWGAKATCFVKKGTTDSVFFNPIRVRKDTLELSGFCVEGCVYRFRKTK